MLWPLRYPAAAASLGLHGSCGILLYGPPGTGDDMPAVLASYYSLVLPCHQPPSLPAYPPTHLPACPPTSYLVTLP